MYLEIIPPPINIPYDDHFDW